MTQSRTRQRKSEIRGLLQNRDTSAIKSWASRERNPMRVLTSLLFDNDTLIVWRAIEAFGLIAPAIAKKDIEKMQKQIQRFLWMMNDESGALCWYAPEAMAEILAHVEPLQKDFVMILPSFLIEEPFEAGTRWGMTLLLEKCNLPDGIIKHFGEFKNIVVDSLISDDIKIKGNSILLIKAMELEIPDEIKSQLVGDCNAFEFYDFETGDIKELAIKDLM